ncbi:MAG TPA: aminotransferase class III-fold pyridoxal phosphate-dependent enzyme, partial [Alphaproteobacteria bacterium]|nr:aminotransferase class III-fold pyridoxal phosphate-dependent enzyme [Alphaproteobacteria bacterium]
PVMAAGGVVVPPKNYFDLIQPILKKYHILLIADEVVCGFWRTGQMFGCQLYGIQPDIITMAKALTSAYMPMGALLINQQMYQVIANNANKIGTFAHGFTYSGHPVCAAVALECLKIYQENNFIAHLQQIIPIFQSRMQQLKNHPLVGEVRGVGLLGGVELVADKISRKPFATNQNVGREALKFMLKTGLILRNYGDTITCCPPLIASTPEIEHMFDLLTQGLDETQKWLQNC